MSKILTITTATQDNELFFDAWQKHLSGEYEMTDKIKAMLAVIAELQSVNPAAAGLVIADATKQAKRLSNRANQPDGMERFELIQTRGPTIEFTGKMIYSDSYVSLKGDEHAFELYETPSGRFVVNKIRQNAGGEEINHVFDTDAGDYMAVMDFLHWEQSATKMAKKMKWQIKIEVE